VRVVVPWSLAVAAFVCAVGCTVTNDAPSNGAAHHHVDSGEGDDTSLETSTDVSQTLDVCGEGLTVSPADATLLVDWSMSAVPPTLRYAFWMQSCDATDLTATSAWSIDDDAVGHFEGNVFVVTRDATRVGARTVVHATHGVVESTTPLTVVQLDTSGARPDLLFSFGGCGGSASQIVAVVVPTGPPLDVAVAPSNDPTSAPTLASVIAHVRAMDEGDVARGCSATAARDTDADGFLDTFSATSGKTLCFEVVPVTPSGAHDFMAWGHLDVTGSPGAVDIDSRRVVYRYVRTLGPC
jgi:hypothetical protein